MKIIDIIIGVAEKGGVENTINMLSEYLQGRGWHVRVIQFVWEKNTWTNPSIEFHTFFEGTGEYNLDAFTDKYCDFLKNNDKPVLILATVWPYMCLIAKKATSMLNIAPTIVSWGHHGPVSLYEKAGFGSYAHLALADACLAINAGIYNELSTNLPEQLVINVRNPVTFQACILSEESIADCGASPVKECTKHLLFVGRISEEKRIETIIDAIAKTGGIWKLSIVGSGSEIYTAKLKEKVNSLCLNTQVYFLGWQESPWECVSDVSACVLASDYEGMPLTALEALSRGIPVITTPTSGVPELIVPGKNGYIFPFGGSDSLAEILLAMSSGILPRLSKSECIRSVLPYNIDYTLPDFEIKLSELASNHKKLALAHGGKEYIRPYQKISIIIPCYNIQDYISQCLDSILHQDYPCEHMEIICINDASTDSTLEILQKYEEAYPDLFIIVNLEEKQGLAVAKNIGLEYASGDYITFVNGDDYLNHDALRIMYNQIMLYSCSIVYSSYNNISNNTVLETYQLSEDFFDMTFSERKQLFFKENGCHSNSWAKLYKTDFIKNNNMFFSEMEEASDAFDNRLTKLSGVSIVTCSAICYNHRINCLPTSEN